MKNDPHAALLIFSTQRVTIQHYTRRRKSCTRFVCAPSVSEKNMIRIVHRCQMSRETALTLGLQTLSKNHICISNFRGRCQLQWRPTTLEQTLVINLISFVAQSHLDPAWPAALLPLSCSAHTHLVVFLLHCILCRI